MKGIVKATVKKALKDNKKIFSVSIDIVLKSVILDPQGKAVKDALVGPLLGFAGISDVRIGKCIKIQLEAKNKKEATATAEDMCKKVLSNPVIEQYVIRFEK